jgi:hypothetical protein
METACNPIFVAISRHVSVDCHLYTAEYGFVYVIFMKFHIWLFPNIDEVGVKGSNLYDC